MNTHHLHHPGFTMVELMISISIFMVITGMVIVNFRSGQYRDELNGAPSIVQAALREMQTAASSGAVTPTSCPDPAHPGQLLPTPGAPASGYGVHFVPPNTVIQFADCETGTSGTKTYTYVSTDPNFIAVRTVVFSSNVTFALDQPVAPVLDVVFDPFVETVRVNGAASTPATLSFRHLKAPTSQPLEIHLNADTGQVFIQPQAAP